MTTTELAQRLVIRSVFDDLSKVDQNGLLVLADVINQANQKYFAAVPECYRQTTGSMLMEAPQSISVTVTNGSSTVSGLPFLTAWRGRTIEIPGDSIQNEITGQGTLLNAYRGDSGTKTALVYSDVVAITDFSVEKINSHPVVRDNRTQLVNAGQYRTTSYRFYDAWFSVGLDRPHGDYPQFYSVDHVGASRADDVLFMLRLDPIPESEFTLNYNFTVRPATVTWSSLKDSPTQLPVDDSLLHRTLLPIAYGLLARTQLWGEGPESAAAALADHNEALVSTSQLPDVLAKPDRRVRTRPGF